MVEIIIGINVHKIWRKNATHFKPLDLDSYAKQFKCDRQQSLSIEFKELKIRFLSFFLHR